MISLLNVPKNAFFDIANAMESFVITDTLIVLIEG